MKLIYKLMEYISYNLLLYPIIKVIYSLINNFTHIEKYFEFLPGLSQTGFISFSYTLFCFILFMAVFETKNFTVGGIFAIVVTYTLINPICYKVMSIICTILLCLMLLERYGALFSKK